MALADEALGLGGDGEVEPGGGFLAEGTVKRTLGLEPRPARDRPDRPQGIAVEGGAGQGGSGEDREVGLGAGLEGEREDGEEEHRGPRVARPWRGLRGMGEG